MAYGWCDKQAHKKRSTKSSVCQHFSHSNYEHFDSIRAHTESRGRERETRLFLSMIFRKTHFSAHLTIVVWTFSISKSVQNVYICICPCSGFHDDEFYTVSVSMMLLYYEFVELERDKRLWAKFNCQANCNDSNWRMPFCIYSELFQFDASKYNSWTFSIFLCVCVCVFLPTKQLFCERFMYAWISSIQMMSVWLCTDPMWSSHFNQSKRINWQQLNLTLMNAVFQLASRQFRVTSSLLHAKSFASCPTEQCKYKDKLLKLEISII